MEFRWAVEKATGRFLYGGTAPYDCEPGLVQGQCRVVLKRPPDPWTEKWDGKQIVAATADEIAAWAPVPVPSLDERVAVLEDVVFKDAKVG